MSELQRFQPDVILRSLIAHDVRFIIVGGVAAQQKNQVSEFYLRW